MPSLSDCYKKQNKSVFHHLVLYLFQLLESIYIEVEIPVSNDN